MLDKKEENELNTLIEHEKKNLMFYALFFEELQKKFPRGEFEKRIDFHLDRLIDLLEKLKG
ncbi:MAG: hypothetical protein LBR67_08405 [Dysgonamonadaceae bacterium]|jgi:hypothetical protein|nr:hypothetical protein [Dysgonamonadaceae bacterium]